MGKKKYTKCSEFFLESSNTFYERVLVFNSPEKNLNISTLDKETFNSDIYSLNGKIPYDYALNIKIWVCPNCNHEEVEIESLKDNDSTGDKVSIGKIIIPLPEMVPINARTSFEEACKILYLSPKASATLSRKTLELMITDFFDKNDGSLFEKIKSLHDESKIDDNIYKSMDGLRLTGNLGAHESTEKIIDINPGEAESMIQLNRLLADEWYVARDKRLKLIHQVTNIGKRIKQERHSK